MPAATWCVSMKQLTQIFSYLRQNRLLQPQNLSNLHEVTHTRFRLCNTTVSEHCIEMPLHILICQETITLNWNCVSGCILLRWKPGLHTSRLDPQCWHISIPLISVLSSETLTQPKHNSLSIEINLIFCSSSFSFFKADFWDFFYTTICKRYTLHLLQLIWVVLLSKPGKHWYRPAPGSPLLWVLFGASQSPDSPPRHCSKQR